MSLESLCQTKSLEEVENVAHEILVLAADRSRQKAVLEDLISHLAEFKETAPLCLSTLETCLVIETSKGHMSKDLEGRLAYS